ncbi:MAG: hypothetical protein ACRDQU_12045 [Pseudonocardiaceae bacterium]
MGPPRAAQAPQPDLEQLRERMAAIKEEAVAEVDRKWGSPFRTRLLFDLKVQARLSGNDEHRSLQAQIREAEAALAAEPDAAPETETAG